MIELVVAALALALAAAAVQAAVDVRAPDPVAAAGSAALGGAVVVAVLLLLDGSRILRWRYGLGAEPDRIELPGAALVLGLALLVTLAGTLAMGAHLLSSAPAPRARRLGQQFLVLGAGLAGLAAAVVVAQAFPRGRAALAAGAADVATLAVAVALLGLALARLLAPVAAEQAPARATRSQRTLRWAAALAAVAAAAAGVEAWRAQGSYATPPVAEATAVALLGLASVQPAPLAFPRAVLFLMSLVAMVARAAAGPPDQ